MYSSSDIFNITELNNIIMDYKTALEAFETHQKKMKQICDDINSIGFVYGDNCWFYLFPKPIFLKRYFDGMIRFTRDIKSIHIVLHSSKILDEMEFREIHCGWRKCV